MAAIGIDLGGTKTEIIAIGEYGRELFRQRQATPRDYQATLDLIAGLVAAAEETTGGPASIGLGIPGTLSPVSDRVKNANSTWLIGHPLHRDLASRLGRPVTVMNDANCFALSEAVDGAGAGFGVVFGVILGTGVGGGIVIDGRILEGGPARHEIEELPDGAFSLAGIVDPAAPDLLGHGPIALSSQTEMNVHAHAEHHHGDDEGDDRPQDLEE